MSYHYKIIVQKEPTVAVNAILIFLFSLCIASHSCTSENSKQPNTEIRAYIQNIQTIKAELTKLKET